jgi:hypothetical protein
VKKLAECLALGEDESEEMDVEDGVWEGEVEGEMKEDKEDFIFWLV